MLQFSCLLFICSQVPGILSQTYITTANGVPLAVNDEVLTVGRNGPLLMDDIEYMETINHFISERIPPRAAHPSGTGAFGYFEVTNDITKYCAADLFSEVGKKTQILARFSASAAEKGQAETIRDMRGFSVKFYTNEGNLDITSVAFEVIGLRSPAGFASFTHAFLKQPDTGVQDPNKIFDLVTSRPETAFFFLFFLSPVAIPNGYRHMNTYSVNVLKLINAQQEVHYARFEFITNQGVENLNLTVAQTLQVSDAQYFTKDLRKAIESGNYPSWTLRMQVINESQVDDLPFDIFDGTKIWPENLVPYIEIGNIVLNQNPINMFAQVEQACFAPSHLVPGIRPSADMMLQARLFSYKNAQRYRLGPNHMQLPVNRPITPVHNYQRDGPMAYDNQGNATNYHPNTYDNYTTSERVKQLNPPYELCGVVDRYDTSGGDNFSQAKEWFEKTLTDDERIYVATVAAGLLSAANSEMQARGLELLNNVSETLPTLIEQVIAQLAASS